MAYNLPKAWSAGLAIPKYVRDEGLKRHAFTTQPAPSGTYDNPDVDNAAFRSGYAVPQYVKDEGYGGGVFTTKWAPRGTYFGPKIPPFLDAPANRVLAAVAAPGGGTAVTVQSLNGLGGVPDTMPLPDAFQQYGQQASSIILKHVMQQPKGKRKATLKSLLGRVDPTLYNRAMKIGGTLEKRGVHPAVALQNGLAQAMGTGILNEVIQTGKSGQAPPARGQLGLGCYGICGSGSALGLGSVALTAAAGSSRAGTTTTAATSNPNLSASDPAYGAQGTTPYLMKVGPFTLIASFEYQCVPGEWAQDDAAGTISPNGTVWSGPNSDGSLTYNGNAISPPGIRVANQSGTLRTPCYRYRLMPTGYTPGALETVAPTPDNSAVIVTQYQRGYHTSLYDDFAPAAQMITGPYLDGVVPQLSWQRQPPNEGNIDGRLNSGLAADAMWTSPSQIPDGLAALWSSAAIGPSGGQYANRFSIYTDGQLADYTKWMNALGIPGTGPDDSHTMYYMPMLHTVTGQRLRPFAKFSHPLCQEVINDSVANGTITAAEGAANTSCNGWGLYLLLDVKYPGQPWSTSNPFVLRMFVSTEPQSSWDFVWGGLKTLTADLIKDAETVLTDLGQVACALLSGPKGVTAAKAAAGPVGAAGALIAGASCGGQVPIAPPFDWTPVIIGAGALVAVIAVLKKHKKAAAK